MSHRRLPLRWWLPLCFAISGGCATKEAYDYTAFWQHPPRSILVLAPLNDSTTVEATYSYLSTVTQPLVDRGYYVFPVAVVDQLLRENGLPTAGEMHQVSLAKVAEMTGADAVLFVTVTKYHNSYLVVTQYTEVRIQARLVDTRTGILLWDNEGIALSDAGGSADIVFDVIDSAITQVVNSGSDTLHKMSTDANYNLFYDKKRGLPYGPLGPRYVFGSGSGDAPQSHR